MVDLCRYNFFLRHSGWCKDSLVHRKISLPTGKTHPQCTSPNQLSLSRGPEAIPQSLTLARECQPMGNTELNVCEVKEAQSRNHSRISQIALNSQLSYFSSKHSRMIKAASLVLNIPLDYFQLNFKIRNSFMNQNISCGYEFRVAKELQMLTSRL